MYEAISRLIGLGSLPVVIPIIVIIEELIEDALIDDGKETKKDNHMTYSCLYWIGYS